MGTVWGELSSSFAGTLGAGTERATADDKDKAASTPDSLLDVNFRTNPSGDGGVIADNFGL